MWPRGFTQVGSLSGTNTEFRGERFRPAVCDSTSKSTAPNARFCLKFMFTADAAHTLADLKPSTAVDAVPSV